MKKKKKKKQKQASAGVNISPGDTLVMKLFNDLI